MRIVPFIVSVSCLACSIHADTLQPFGDEFDDAATLSRYQEHGALEGWGPSHIELADIDTTSPGNFRVVPRTTGWYEHMRGTHFSKNVTGDFVATAHVFVYSRQNPGGPLLPSIRLFSLGGILVREPRNITHAAPNPYTTNAVWPPQSFGSDWTPGDENWANTSEVTGKGENYLFLSLGTAGNSGARQFEIKTTRRSRSELYFSSNGISGSREAWLQMVRVGNTIVCLRKHSVGGPWIVENRYPNADHAFPQFGPTLQVGITAYTDFNSVSAYEAGGPSTQFHVNYIAVAGQPDLILDVDYLHLQRPAPALTEAVLQSMSTSYNPTTNQTANPPTELSASPVAAPWLGDNANVPLGQVAFSVSTINVNEADANAVITVTRTGNSTNLPMSLSYATDDDTASAGSDYAATSGTLIWAANESPSKNITVPLLGDASAEGSEEFTITLGALDGPVTFSESAPEIIATIEIEDSVTGFDAWRDAEFGAAANSPEAQAEADFDFDGLKNLIEYGMVSDPTLSDASAIPVGKWVDGEFTFTFRRRLTATDLIYDVQASDALGTWTTIAGKSGAAAWTTAPGNAVSDPGTGTVVVTGAGPFMRLRVTRL